MIVFRRSIGASHAGVAVGASTHAHASVEVVDRLSANLRYARDVFVQRAASRGVIGATLFEQELCAKLDEVGETALGRHLSIAAYELTQPGEGQLRTEAS